MQFALLEAIADQFEAGYQAESIVFYGLRGMGKTVFLRDAVERLRARGWLCGYYSVRHRMDAGVAVASLIAEAVPLLPVGSRLARFASKLHARIGSATVMAGTGGLSVEVSATVPERDLYADLVDVLRRLGEKARDDGAGVAVVIDEMQALRLGDMAALVEALGSVGASDGLPVVLVGAGLPHLPSELSKACTWAERLRYESVGRLPAQAARRALVEPAAELDVTYAPEAADLLLNRGGRLSLLHSALCKRDLASSGAAIRATWHGDRGGLRSDGGAGGEADPRERHVLGALRTCKQRRARTTCSSWRAWRLAQPTASPARVRLPGRWAGRSLLCRRRGTA